MSARDEVRRDYIIGCLREAGAMCEDDARAYLAYHDAARRAEVLNEAAACEVADCSSYIGPKPYPADGWVFVQINGHAAMEPGGWYHCTACAIAALRAAEAGGSR